MTVPSAPPPLPPAVVDLVHYEVEGPARVHRGLPSATLTLILALEDPLETTWEAGENPPSLTSNWTLVSNLHLSPAYVVQPRRQIGVQLALHPLAARRILGCPAAALSDQSCEASDVAGAWLSRLRARTETSPTPDRRGLIDQAMRRAWTDGERGPRVRAEVVQAWRRLAASGGRTKISDVAAEVGLSERRLAALFSTETGRSLKTVAQLIRFQRAVRLLKDHRGLAEVSARCGFSDQSHLDRAFRRFAGCSPSRWVAEEGLNMRPQPGPTVAEGVPIRPSQAGCGGAE